MLPKKQRAETKTIEKIFKKGDFFNSPNLTFRFIKTSQLGSPRISFIVPKGISKSAVKRNLLRRHGYSALEKKIHEFPTGLIGAFVFKKFESSVAVIGKDINMIISKL